MKQIPWPILVLVPLLAFNVFSVTISNVTLDTNKKINFSGSASITEMQFRAGHHWTQRTDPPTTSTQWHDESFPSPMWAHEAHVDFKLDTRLSQRFRVIVNPVFEIWYDRFPVADVTANLPLYPFREHWSADIAQGEGIFSLGDAENPFLSIEAGIFPFKYNAEAVNLGEYLFRSGCYPPFITTHFDFPYATLAGLRLHSTLIRGLSQDLLLTAETRIQPLYDWSLSYLVNYSLPSWFTIGAGVDFSRLFPASDEVTTPKVYMGAPNSTDMYLDGNGDTAYYSFKGIKVMGKVCFDPKGFFPGFAEALGKEDGKIFAEAAILGLKNINAYKKYSTTDGSSALMEDTSTNYYNDISQRIPIMFGFNVPTFKLLDLFALQGEWYGWNFKDALYYQTTSGPNAIPSPFYSRSYPRDVYKTDNWKWSVNVQKTLVRHFSIIAQLSRDHTRSISYYELFKDENEMLTKNNEWGWWLKLKFSF